MANLFGHFNLNVEALEDLRKTKQSSLNSREALYGKIF